MKQILLAVTFLLSGVTFAGGKEASVELQSLLKDPQKYNGKIVEVTGVSRIEFEDNALYPDKTAYSNRVYEKGIWLEIAKTSFEDKKNDGMHVVVKGKFNASNKGHMGLWKGALENVTKLEILKK